MSTSIDSLNKSFNVRPLTIKGSSEIIYGSIILVFGLWSKTVMLYPIAACIRLPGQREVGVDGPLQPPGPIRKSPLAPSTSQTKHAVQHGKFCWHGVLDCITTTLTEQETRSKRLWRGLTNESQWKAWKKIAWGGDRYIDRQTAIATTRKNRPTKKKLSIKFYHHHVTQKNYWSLKNTFNE